MNAIYQQQNTRSGDALEVIAFHLQDQEFCVKTVMIREIRGWGSATPIPHSPEEVLGVMNLRGTVIPVIDLGEQAWDAQWGAYPA
jgi:purine-binding chemotaxis protein CheW